MKELWQLTRERRIADSRFGVTTSIHFKDWCKRHNKLWFQLGDSLHLLTPSNSSWPQYTSTHDDNPLLETCRTLPVLNHRQRIIVSSILNLPYISSSLSSSSSFSSVWYFTSLNTCFLPLAPSLRRTIALVLILRPWSRAVCVKYCSLIESSNT